jgi:hypothetical protein
MMSPCGMSDSARINMFTAELPGFTFEIAQEIEREVVEGKLHTGMASVVQLLSFKIQKPAIQPHYEEI